MINDPIVNEIREIRRAYAERFNNDLHAICEDLRRQEAESEREFRTTAVEETTDGGEVPVSAVQA